jgi:hypothetical protein
MVGETRKNSSIGGNTRKCRGGVRAILHPDTFSESCETLSIESPPE